MKPVMLATPDSSLSALSSADQVPIRPSSAEALTRGHLLRPLTSFIGRERELTALIEPLQHEDVRRVTLTGPGGVGKTRLAKTIAYKVAAHFADGVVWVDLAP